jgi:hypothetical protein
MMHIHMLKRKLALHSLSHPSDYYFNDDAGERYGRNDKIMEKTPIPTQRRGC